MASSSESVLVRLVAAAIEDLRVADHTMVTNAAARTLYDALVCMSAGRRVTIETGFGMTIGPATIVGTTRGADPVTAAVENAISSHVHDLDDLHWPSFTHPGSMIWPALVATSQAKGIPIGELGRAAAFGYQLIARMSATLGEEHRRAFHVSTTAGAVGVAGAVARLLSESENEVVTAVAHAASGIGGTAQAVREHSSTAALHRGYAVAVGMIAGNYRTLTPAVSHPLTGRHGFGSGTRTSFDEAHLDEREPPAICETTQRRHQVNGFAHTLVDLLLDVGPIGPGDVEHVEIEVPQLVVDMTTQADPSDASEARWNLRHIAAAALTVGVAPGWWPLSGWAQELAERIDVRPRPAVPPDLAVRVTLVIDGGHRAFDRKFPRGHPRLPFTDRDLVDKAVSLGVADETTGRSILAGLVARKLEHRDLIQLASIEERPHPSAGLDPSIGVN